MKILITGADSFIGRNLKIELNNRNYQDIVTINDCSDMEQLEKQILECDFIFHLLTVYRSNDASDFEAVNAEITRKIIEFIGAGKKSILLLSSTQAGNNSDYGSSKAKAEEYLLRWSNATGNRACIFRLANEFGKWCPPNLNSVVATFCNNIANNKEIKINDQNAPLKLMYIDDIIDSFISVLEKSSNCSYCEINKVYETTVGDVAKIIQSFQLLRRNNDIVDMSDELVKKLYSTFLSYLPMDDFSVPLNTHIDNRGSFTELLHFGGMGQVSVNISKPGITKGNHWHHTKNEKFIVISGNGIIRLRKVGDSRIIIYHVSGGKMEIVDIPPGYTHNITNTGETDMITIMWANECFDNQKPDTYFEEV